nr:two-component regulator propeller domain-containing protein [Neiella litorisoli]
MHQDQYGFLWFAGRLGLARFDGYDFEIFRYDDTNPATISADTVHDIAQDSDGNLWFGTERGLSRYNYASENFDNFYPAPLSGQANTPVYRIHFDSKVNDNTNHDIMWLATGRGLCLGPNQTTDAICHSNDQIPATMQQPEVFDLAADQTGHLYLASSKGLISWHQGSGVVEHFAEQPNVSDQLQTSLIRSVFVDSQNQIWVGSEQGLLKYLPASQNFEFYPTQLDASASATQDSPSSAAVWDIYEDRQGILWVATDGFGVQWLNRELDQLMTLGSFANNSYSLGSNAVRSILETASGDMWFGLYPSNVSVFERHSSPFYGVTDTRINEIIEPINKVRSIVEDHHGHLWLALDGNGLARYRPENGQYDFFHYQPGNIASLSSDGVLDLHLDNDGWLWIVAGVSGITKYHIDSDRFVRLPPLHQDAASHHINHYWTIYRDRANTLWLGSIGGGLTRVGEGGQSSQVFEHDPNDPTALPDINVWAMREDSQGNFWLATEQGLARMDREQQDFKVYKTTLDDPSSLHSDQIRAIFEDAQGRLWIGTNGGGLSQFHYHNETFSTITREHGLPSDVVVSITEDRQGNLWLGTDRGLVSFDPESRLIRNFDSSFGIAGNVFNVGAVLFSSFGEIFFGGQSGYTRFDPTEIKARNARPKVVFTDIEILNEPVPINERGALRQSISVADEVWLNHRQNVVSFEVSALNFRSSAANRYAYKLDGFDQNWIQLGNHRRITYTNLDAGTYTLRAKAQNREGRWSAQDATITLHVRPAPWRTWWAYSLYVALILSVVLAYVHNQNKRRQELEQRVRERTQELHQANEKLTQISFSDPLTGLNNRRFFEQFIDADVAEVTRRYESWQRQSDQPPPANSDLAFFLIDLDHFKQVNDVHGHSAGDIVLKRIAELLKQATRASDYVIRWGGEEFLVLSRFVSHDYASDVAERICQSVRQQPIRINDQLALDITCSVGFASYNCQDQQGQQLSWQQIIDIADINLYCAKNSGRNGWVGVAGDHQQVSDVGSYRQQIEQCQIKVLTSLESPLQW